MAIHSSFSLSWKAAVSPFLSFLISFLGLDSFFFFSGAFPLLQTFCSVRLSLFFSRTFYEPRIDRIEQKSLKKKWEEEEKPHCHIQVSVVFVFFLSSKFFLFPSFCSSADLLFNSCDDHLFSVILLFDLIVSSFISAFLHSFSFINVSLIDPMQSTSD